MDTKYPEYAEQFRRTVVDDYECESMDKMLIFERGGKYTELFGAAVAHKDELIVVEKSGNIRAYVSEDIHVMYYFEDSDVPEYSHWHIKLGGASIELACPSH